MLIQIRPIVETIDELRAGLEHPEYYFDKVEKLKPDSNRLHEILAVRCLLRDMLGEELHICYTAEGAPYLDAIPQGYDSVPHLSISHTRGYMAVALNEQRPIGIDIELRGNRVQRVVSHFLQPIELETLHAGVGEEQYLLALHLAWSAKEAAYKVLGRAYYDLQNLTTIEHLDWEKKQLRLAVKGRVQPLLVHFDYTETYVVASVVCY